ncbi:MAG: hypothetical protein ACI9K5_003724, partial [Gammaproteobacteria bacterium]
KQDDSICMPNHELQARHAQVARAGLLPVGQRGEEVTFGPSAPAWTHLRVAIPGDDPWERTSQAWERRAEH